MANTFSPAVQDSFAVIQSSSKQRLQSLVGGSAAALTLALTSATTAQAETCSFLQPIGGDGQTPVVSKTVSRAKLLGRTNWNTDFIVDRPYQKYKFFFTANSSDANAEYPVEGYMKFTDGTSLQVINASMTPPVGTGKEFGPFAAVPGKQASQMNFKVGASNDPGALGFSYRISVQGCN
ncbi:hypothetical protein [Cyanobium sp. LEGE 06113]|uniref:hypothetical protein n=1 Tax=Cyanobium sp. LEGE 06113 TaxID=1297573 RepID=UPI001D1435E7|nr:hypothetical protein [Cyanobium sp. LEGE 06113]